MKRTMRWPLELEGGRAAMTEDPAADPVDPGAALRQTIRLSLLPGECDNPWRDQGAPDRAFAGTGPAARAHLRSFIAARFDDLESRARAKLAAVTFPAAEAGVFPVMIEYTDLETGRRESMEIARNG